MESDSNGPTLHRAVTCLFDIDLKKVNPPVDWDVDQVLDKMAEILLIEFLLQQSGELPLPNNDRQITLSPKTFPSEDNGVVPAVVITLRAYNALQLICITLECAGRVRMRNVAPGELVTLNDDVIEMLRDRLSSCHQPPLQVEAIPIIKRANQLPTYLPLSDGRLAEYDFDRVIVDQDSPYQNIKILHSRTFGNTLLLDGCLNMAESDIVYTSTLMNLDDTDVSYADKEILILGGGDGSLLHELLKKNPKYVTMCELDQQVMDCCRMHLRSVCGDSLDTLKSDRHEIIVDDCMAQMQLFIEQNRQFDVIFNDLTDIPLSSIKPDQRKCQIWTFIKQVLNKSLQCLKKDGFYMNHATGANCDGALQQYENVLNEQLQVKVKYKRRQMWVPSFLENWTFYEIKFDREMESQ